RSRGAPHALAPRALPFAAGGLVPRSCDRGAPERIRRPRSQAQDVSAQVEVRAMPVPVPGGPRQSPPCAVVIFGATGDLTRRKLIPALYNVWSGSSLRDPLVVVAFARREWSKEAFQHEMLSDVNEFSRRKPADPKVWDRFGPKLHYVQGEVHDPAAYQRLAQQLARIDQELGTQGNRLFYLATPPSEFATILHRLKEAGMIAKPHGEPSTRVILEKPFGRDLESAKALNSLVAHVLDESQTFRIDHYLGKETVQHILVLRFP